MQAVGTVLARREPQAPKVNRKAKAGRAMQGQQAVRMAVAAMPPLRWVGLPGRAGARKALRDKPEQPGPPVALEARPATTEPTRRTVALRPHPQAAATVTARPPMEVTASKAPAQTAQPAETKAMVNPVTKVLL
jgi:hypothetical protein